MAFYDVSFSDFIGNIFERVKNGKHLFANKIPLFRKERARGRFNYCNLFKINLPNPSLQKRGFFMMFLLVILLGMYLRELRTENVYEAIKLPLFRKEGAGGDSLFQSIQNQFPHHFNMCFFSIQCGDIVIRDTAMI